MTCKEAVNKTAQIIYSVHDDVKDKPFELELSWVCEDSKKQHVFVPGDILLQANEAGKKSTQDQGSDDEEE